MRWRPAASTWPATPPSTDVELAELKVTRYEVGARVATITLHRPDRLNAWTGRMHAEYRSLLQRAATDPGVRVIVVTGSGRGFCAGADARALEGHVERGGVRRGPRRRRGHARLRRPAGVRCGLRLPVRHPQADHRRRQRAGRRRRPRARLLLRPALRGAGGQADHVARPPRPAGRVRPVVVAAPPGRRHPGRRPAAVEPGRAGRGGGAARAGQPGAGARRAAAVHLRLRRAARHGDRSVLAGRDEAAALPRPARRRRLVGARRQRPHGRHDGEAPTSPRAWPP